MDDDQIKDFDDLPSVDPVDSDELLCGRGRIAFSAFVALMKGDIEAAVSLAEQAKLDTEDIYDLAEELLEAVQTAKGETEAIKTDTATIKSETEAIKTAIETIKTETEAIKTATATIKSETETIKSETEQIKTDTTAIKTATQTIADDAEASAEAAEESAAEAAASAATIATTTSLAKQAQSRGELYFPNYTCAYSSGNVIDFYNFTMAFNFKDTNTSAYQFFLPCSLITSLGNSSATRIGIILSTQYSYARLYMRYTVDGTVYENYIYTSSSVYLLLTDGNYHNIVIICRGTTQNEDLTYTPDVDLYIDGELCTTSSSSKAAPLPTSDSCYIFLNSSWNTYTTTSQSANKTAISDLKIFNFGLPANDEADTDGVGYTVQDYYNGVAVPPLLQYENAEKRCIFNLENYTYTVGSTQYVAASIGNNLTCATGSSATNSPKGTHDNAEKVRSDLTISNS